MIAEPQDRKWWNVHHVLPSLSTSMSFGFSLSDFALVIGLAVKVHSEYKQSAGEYRELTKDIEAFAVVLEQAQDTSKLIDLGAQESGGSERLTSRSKKLLDELYDFRKEYASLEKNTPPRHDRLKWSWVREKAEGFRRRIHEQMVTWTAYNSFIARLVLSSASQYMVRQGG